MRTLRTTSAFDLFDRLEKQLNQQLSQQLAQPQPTADHVPAAEVTETADAYVVVLELPGVDKGAIDVQASDRSLLITAQRRRSDRAPAASQCAAAAAPAALEAASTPEADLWAEAVAPEPAAPEAASAVAAPTAAARPGAATPLLREFRYGTWTRRFRLPQPIEREQLRAIYRDGLLTITAPKATTTSTVSVTVEG